MICKLIDIAEFNPTESLKKGTVAKKVAMEQLRPFCRDISNYTLEPFNGGTKFRNGDTIMARITPCLENGKTAKVNILDDDEIGFGSTEYIVFRAKEGICDEDYLYYLICSPIVRDIAIKSMVGSTGRQRVQIDVVQNIAIDLPDISEQKKIGALLRSLDDKIELNNKVNENLEQQAQILFKAWFIDYVPFNCVKPSNWLLYPLGEITEMGAGGDKPEKTSDNKSDEYPYPIYSNGINNDGLYGYTNKAKIFSESVTVSARGTIGFVCLRHLPYVPIVRLITLIPNENFLNAKYLYLYLKQLHISGTGTTQQQLTVPDFSKIEILIPDEHSMRKFTKIISPMFKNIWLNKEENISLAAIRDSLLPKLMSGEIDVSDIRL